MKFRHGAPFAVLAPTSHIHQANVRHDKFSVFLQTILHTFILSTDKNPKLWKSN